MKDEHLEPARSVIAKLGVEKVAEITGKHVSRVYRWMYSKARGGTGGFIPPLDAQLLLQYANANEIALSPFDFMVSAATATPQQIDDMLEAGGCRITDAAPATPTPEQAA